MLVVAGHDPSYRFENGRGDGAGVDADKEAAGYFGVATVNVVTAWTEQEAGRVLDIGPVPPAIWLSEALRFGFEMRHDLSAMKLGLLPSEEAVRMAAKLVRELRKIMPTLPVVVDPVLGASGGEEFLGRGGREALMGDLASAGVVLTPNRLEAAALLGCDANEDPELVARSLFARTEGPSAPGNRVRGIVLKGGHGKEDPVRDITVAPDGSLHTHEHPRHLGASLHGSGCRHASAVAANLALGLTLPEASKRAGQWLGTLLSDC
jgi:hydroxymethylpyrimidine/phosphomethylpyrimidine kinase